MPKFISEINKIAIASAVESLQFENVDDGTLSKLDGLNKREIVLAVLAFGANLCGKFIRETDFEVEEIDSPNGVN